MDENGIHIISFDVPYPTDYGGVIDVYNRCKYLKATGTKVILHCFEYGRGRPKELEKVADEVYYYPRNKSIFSLFTTTPFIVKTRSDRHLLERLCKDNLPIIFEGIHTCFYLSNSKLKNRWKGVRAHNIEHDYYRELAKAEPRILQKLFFLTEAWKLKKYERIFHQADEILAVTPKDESYFQKKYHKGIYLPVFNPLKRSEEAREVKKYALFHGNLSVKENEFAVRYIVDRIWQKDFPLALKIAGKNPPEELIKYLQSKDFPIDCINSPDDITLNELIRNAKINLLPTFQNTGIKHKLLNCLSNGGFCLANSKMVEGTGLGKFCVIVNSIDEWRAAIMRISSQEEDQNTFHQRLLELQYLFDATANAHKILELSKQKKETPKT